MAARMVKSAEEIELIKGGARTADVGGAAIHAAIREGATEIEIAMAGRDAMEVEIARAYPDAEYRDTWVWFQSGLNTDGAHNPVTKRALQKGDILSLNTFPMISGYYTALERTLFLGRARRRQPAPVAGQCRRPRAGAEPDQTRRDLFRHHRRDQPVLRRSGPAAIPLVRVWALLRHPQPLLRPRGRS